MSREIKYDSVTVQRRIAKLTRKWKEHEKQKRAQIDSIMIEIDALKNTIKWFKKKIEPHDCGWMYTTIDGIKERIKHLRKEKRCLGK